MLVIESNQLRMSNDLNDILGFNQNQVFLPGKVVSTRVANVNRGMDSICILSNIIHDQAYGGTKAKVLRIVDVRGSKGEIVHQQFENINYFPVSRHSIDSIQIGLVDDKLQPIDFKYGRATVVLAFRKWRH